MLSHQKRLFLHLKEPRGRYSVELHMSFVRLQGQANDVKIQYSSIIRLLVLLKLCQTILMPLWLLHLIRQSGKDKRYILTSLLSTLLPCARLSSDTISFDLHFCSFYFHVDSVIASTESHL